MENEKEPEAMPVQPTLPRYLCHKRVSALRISGLEQDGDKLIVTPTENGYSKIILPWSFVDKHGPIQVGGYYVVYDDGYESYSPAEAFEGGYTRIQDEGDQEVVATLNLDFGAALYALKQGRRLCRAGWNGKGMWLCLSPGKVACAPESLWAPENAKFAAENGGTVDVLPYITMKTADNKIVPWLASQTDLLADDWMIC